MNLKNELIYLNLYFLCFPGSSAGKESVWNSWDPGSTPGLGRSPGGGHGNPLQYSCLENPHGQRSLAGYIKSMGLQTVRHDWPTKHTHDLGKGYDHMNFSS